MLEKVTTNLARIEVQRRFCNHCSSTIKNELKKISEVNNIRVYPKESLVTFNFTRALKLATALNILSEIGYPEKGERNKKKQFSTVPCGC